MNRREFIKFVTVAPFVGALPVVAKETEVKDFYPTGLPTLDEVLGGGLKKGSLTIILGGKGSGKTALCRHILRNNFPHSIPIYNHNYRHQKVLNSTDYTNDQLVMGLLGPYEGAILNCDFDMAFDYESIVELKKHALNYKRALIISSNFDSLKESYAVLRPADVVLQLFRLQYRTFVDVAKNRNGKNGIEIPLKFSKYYWNGQRRQKDLIGEA